MVDLDNLTCQNCNNVGFDDGWDGFFYCRRCRERSDEVVDTAVDPSDAFANGGDTRGGGLYSAGQPRQQQPGAISVEPISRYDSYESQPNFIRYLGLEDETPQRNEHGQVKNENIITSQFDGASPSIPADFGGLKVARFEDYYNEIRMRYVMGLQIMIELQCEALVKEFKVTPLICGLVGPIWLRFVSKTGIFDDDWADKEIHDSEMQKEGEPEDYILLPKYRAEPRNMFGQRAVMIWFRSLKKRIPLAYTVTVSYLACHIAREAILPSDIMKWTGEGKLPYFSAFVEIESRMGHPSIACPINSSVMFRPQRAVSVQKLESYAASIAQFIGLELPPVNFFAIAYRYLEKLSLPVEKILPYACRVYEWSMPSDLWLSLSTDHFRLPTHVCVVSILVVAIRILYEIHGYGEWENSLSRNDGAKDNNEMDTTFASHEGHDFGKDSAKDPVGPQNHKLDSAGLLLHLQAIYNEIEDTHEYSKDLPTYLKYCRDVVFAGLEPSYGNHEEQKMIENLWNFYQNEENSKPSEPAEQSNTSFNRTRLRGEGCIRRTSKKVKMCDLGKSAVKEAIERMKLDMEENRFYYIPPSVKPKESEYVRYSRKKDEGALTYVAPADYYILLRAFARIAQVDIRILHIGALSLERRLAWLEKRIDQCLLLEPPTISCQFCSVRAIGNGSDEVPELSNLNI